MSSPYGSGPSAGEGIANALARNAAGKNGNNRQFSGVAEAPSSAGQSSRLAAHRAKMGRDAHGAAVASIAPTGRATVSAPAAGSPAPGKASISAQSAALAKPNAHVPTAKISDEQLRLNHRSFAVLSHPKAEGKGRAVMAMLNADKRLTAFHAITRLDSLPFDDAKRQAEAKATATREVWDAAHASAFPNYRAAAEPPKAAQDGTAARTSSSDTKPSASDIWNQAYARVFGVEDTNPTTPTARSKPNTADVWDQALAGLKVA